MNESNLPRTPGHPSALSSLKSLQVKSVLVATDLSKPSDRALQHGMAIACHYRAVLYVVNVVSSLAFTLAGPFAVEAAVEASERDIAEMVNRLILAGDVRGIDIRPIVLRGNIDKELECFVKEHQADLIVVGTHGRKGMAGVAFGSIAQLISKSSSCPVLTVGPHACGPWLDNPDDMGKPLLFATALNQASARAMPYAIALAHDFERPLFVLHVKPPQGSHLLAKHRTEKDDSEASTLERLSALISSRASVNCAAEFLVESCDPADGILRAAKRVHAATIIMGTHRDSVSDLTIRLPWSIANRVNREASCPVLTVGV